MVLILVLLVLGAAIDAVDGHGADAARGLVGRGGLVERDGERDAAAAAHRVTGVLVVLARVPLQPRLLQLVHAAGGRRRGRGSRR